MKCQTIRPAPRNSISHTRHRTDSASTNLLRTETTRSYRPDSADSKSKEATVHAVEPRNAVAQLTPIFLSKMIYRDLTDEEAKKDPDADVCIFLFLLCFVIVLVMVKVWHVNVAYTISHVSTTVSLSSMSLHLSNPGPPR